MIRQTKQKLKYEYPDRDTASSFNSSGHILTWGDVRHREKIEDIQGKPKLKKCRGMTFEQTAAHLGKKKSLHFISSFTTGE